jgi:hypothetical protein
MRSDGRGTWLAQFERDIKTGNERDEWAHGDGQTTSDQATYAGKIEGAGPDQYGNTAGEMDTEFFAAKSSKGRTHDAR